MINNAILVSVLLKRTDVLDNEWISERWQALGAIPVNSDETSQQNFEIILDHQTSQIYRYNGLQIEIYHEELESYYQNLSSDNACIFIVCSENEKNHPIPFLVTLSYDEAAVYMETDEIVYSAPIPTQIYHIIETFVLEHYQPKKFKKRKLIKGNAEQHYAEEGSCE